ncbi:MAG: UbiD family decarboxylase [Chromatiales bacterium]|nr:UbiD family decarboxylase [Chromatiales bacterium]
MSDSLLSRREILAAGSTLAALSATLATAGCAAGGATAAGGLTAGARSPASAPRAPFDTLRDYVAALDAHGLLLRIPEVDQDAYQATGLVFRANDRYTYFGVPALYFDRVKIGGKWVQGPLVGLLQANLHTDAIVFGQAVVPGNGPASYRNAKAYLAEMLKKNNGSYPQIPPVTIAREKALCKQVVLRGDDIDLTKFAFVQTNPVDAGRYVNTGSVFMNDPVMGGNFGTYRCQLKGPRLLGLNPEPNQTGWKMLMAARKRGEATAKVSIALGQDPVVWFISGTRVANRFGDKPVDELALAGGFRGKPVEVVKSETNDLLVPAHAEMIIEGEVPLQGKGLPEGPFGEMFGYMGPAKEDNFFLNVTAVTHRRDPWIMNAFTGMQRGMVTSPQDALYDHFLRRAVPGLIEIYQPQDLMGVAILSIDKKAPGEGMKAGRVVAERNPIAKVVIVVDKDVDVMDRTQVLFAVGSRWQPSPAAEIIKDVTGIITDPSQPVQGRTSKIVIDATIQWPEEGGRPDFPATNRALLEKGAPDALAEVDRLYGATLAKWGAT